MTQRVKKVYWHPKKVNILRVLHDCEKEKIHKTLKNLEKTSTSKDKNGENLPLQGNLS